MTLISGTLHADLRTYVIISGLVIVKMRNVSDHFVGKIETYILVLVCNTFCVMYNII